MAFAMTSSLRLTRPATHGPEVRRLQERLARLGDDAGTPDGVFGQKTERAVKAFQRDHALLVEQLRGLGILMPAECLAAAREAKLPLHLAASLLVQESGGGRNVYGHDPTIFVGGPGGGLPNEVTEANYKEYLRLRGEQGEGGMQGVGPCQLTWWSYQDEADELGGCWDPLANMRVGFKRLADDIRRYGLHPGVKAYNGSGAAADAYATEVLARADTFRAKLG